MIECGIAFDCRSSKKSGGARDDSKKWMKASAVNILLEKMPTIIWKLCDIRFLSNTGDPEPLPANLMPEDDAPDEQADPADADASRAAMPPPLAPPGRAATAQPSQQSASTSRPTAAQQAVRRAPSRSP